MRRLSSIKENMKTAHVAVIVCHLALMIILIACASPTSTSGTIPTEADITKPSVETTQQNDVKEQVEMNLSAGEVITPENADQITILDRIVTGINVLSVAFSPDGRILATGGNGNVKLWDTTS